jgi:hypothetical protein
MVDARGTLGCYSTSVMGGGTKVDSAKLLYYLFGPTTASELPPNSWSWPGSAQLGSTRLSGNGNTTRRRPREEAYTKVVTDKVSMRVQRDVSVTLQYRDITIHYSTFYSGVQMLITW